MITRAKCIDILSSHADELRSRYGISSMRLLGSVVSYSHKEGNDVDLFVTMPSRFFK